MNDEQYRANLFYQLRDPTISDSATIEELEELIDKLHRDAEAARYVPPRLSYGWSTPE